MNRKTLREQADAVVAPMLARGELLRRSGPVWALEERGRVPLLLRARDPHILVLTDQRLVLFAQPRRRRPLAMSDLVIAKRYSTFTPVSVHRLRPMLQLRMRTGNDRLLVLEFRPRDRGLGRELAVELGPPRPDAGRRARARGRAGRHDEDPPRPADEQDLAELLGP